LAASRGPGAAMPTTLPAIDPVVLVPRAHPFDDSEWMFEPKYDGFRGFLYAAASGCDIRSVWDNRFDGYAELCDRVAGVIGRREVILDGEIVSLDPKGKPLFRELLRGRGFLAFAAFDLLWLDGRDFRSAPLSERKRHLAELLPSDTGPLYKVFTLEEHGRALFEATRKMDLEGIVAKRRSDPYGAATLWYKIRNPAYRQSEGWMDVGQAARTRLRSTGRGVVEK